MAPWITTVLQHHRRFLIARAVPACPGSSQKLRTDALLVNSNTTLAAGTLVHIENSAGDDI